MPIHHSVQHFADAAEHARKLANMKQQYFQLESGTFGSTLEQFNLDGLHLFSEHVNRRIVECGEISHGMITIGWASYTQVAPSTRGREISNFTIGSARGGSEWIVHLPAEAEILGVTMTETEFDILAERLDHRTNRHSFRSNTITPAGETSIAAVRRLRERVGHLRAHAGRLDCPRTRHALRKALLDDVFYAIEEAAPPNRDDLTRLTYNDIVKRCQDYVLRNAGNPVTVLDLCTEVRVSRRTLQTCFRHVTGQSPLDYLRAVRLGEVRKMLRDVPATQMSIASIAARWGFIHLGKFANNYRRLFGELPSQTARYGMRA